MKNFKKCLPPVPPHHWGGTRQHITYFLQVARAIPVPAAVGGEGVALVGPRKTTSPRRVDIDIINPIAVRLIEVRESCVRQRHQIQHRIQNHFLPVPIVELARCGREDNEIPACVTGNSFLRES